MITTLFDAFDFFVNRYEKIDKKLIEVLLRGYHVIDGDTVVVLRVVGDGLVDFKSVRLAGIDTPENHTRNLLEKQAGNLIKECVERIIGAIPRKYRRVEEIEADKYAGRFLGRIWDSRNPIADVSRTLIQLGLCKPYNGGTKSPWTADELNAVIEVAERFLQNGSRIANDDLTRYQDPIKGFIEASL